MQPVVQRILIAGAGEPCVPGDSVIRVLSSDVLGRLSSIICFEADFPDFVRQVSIEGPEKPKADLVAVSVNDWEAIAESHLHMSAFRAIENGAWFVRSTSSGYLADVSPIGKIVSQSPRLKWTSPFYWGASRVTDGLRSTLSSAIHLPGFVLRR